MNHKRLIIYLIAILLTIALVAGSANAQENSNAEDSSISIETEISAHKELILNPLKPADKSSPQDTLKSFLANMAIALKDKQEHGKVSTPVGFLAFARIF